MSVNLHPALTAACEVAESSRVGVNAALSSEAALSRSTQRNKTTLPSEATVMPLSIDVVVRTQADASRSKLLFRALDSIQTQDAMHARPIVVVNGANVDDAVWAALARRPNILLHRERRKSAGLAMSLGRALVVAPYFAFLDDDDELIPGSLQNPLTWLASHGECDVVISNGYFVKQDGVRSELHHIADHVRRRNPALGLLLDGWLTPGAFICRTASIPPSMVNEGWSNMEWTRLAFELCAERKRLHFMDVPTMCYYDTPGSLSKAVRHHEAELELLAQVRGDARFDVETRHAASRKYLRTLHHLAMKYWEQGDHARAWRCHLGSLRPPYTFKYLLVSRKLLWPSARRAGGQ